MPSSVRLAFHHWRQPQTLNLPNRRVRTRMHGGVGGGSCEASPYPDRFFEHQLRTTSRSEQREGRVVDDRVLFQVQCGARRALIPPGVVPSHSEILVHSRAHPPAGSPTRDWDSISASRDRLRRVAPSCGCVQDAPDHYQVTMAQMLCSLEMFQKGFQKLDSEAVSQVGDNRRVMRMRSEAPLKSLRRESREAVARSASGSCPGGT
jgi:hypothetical protein